MWVPREETDPVLWHYPGRKSVGYFGAVRLRGGRGLFQKETGMFEGATFWPFLQRLRLASAASGRTVIVITDNAQYHHAKLHQAWRQEQAPAFTLDYLPPYSPELNPIERVWKLIRRRCLHNRYFLTLNEVVTAIAPRLRDWSRPNTTLQRLCGIR